jgi:hypothetical protein
MHQDSAQYLKDEFNEDARQFKIILDNNPIKHYQSATLISMKWSDVVVIMFVIG